MQISTRKIEIAVALFLLVIPILLLFVIYPVQIPQSPFNELNARLYPNSLAVMWIIVAIVNLAQALRLPTEGKTGLDLGHLRRIGVIFSIVCVGFALLNLVGFLTGAFFYIITFAWMLGERGRAALIAALVVPALIYAAMLYGFNLSLPTVLDRF